MASFGLRILLSSVCLLTFGMTEASAANWHIAVEMEPGAIYVDIDSVRKNPDNLIFWNDDRFISGRAKGKKTRCLTEVSYLQGLAMVRDLQCIHYDINGKSYGTDQVGPWEAVTPGSAMEATIRFADQFSR